MASKSKTRVALISLYNREFAFGLRQLSSVLQSNGHYCDLIFFKQMGSVDPTLCLELTPNANFFSPHTSREMNILIETLSNLKPDLVGLSVISSFFGLAAEITAEIRQKLGAPVIWGGIHPTILPEDCIRHADMICVGEGEGAILDLADSLHDGKPVSKIKNLWIKEQTGGIIKNDLRPLVEDLDSLGFPDYTLDENKFYIENDCCSKTPPDRKEHPGKTIDLMTSRGCPFQCSYCCVHVLREKFKGKGPFMRRRSVESVIEEITHALTINTEAQFVHFWDDVFTFDKVWIKKFAEEYQRTIGLPFTCYAHPRYTDAEILSLLKKAGLQYVNLGIQTGSPRTSRELYHRQSDNEEILKAASVMKELGLSPWYDLIVDNPYETDEDHRSTLNLLLKLPRPFELNMHSLCYFPKTKLTENALADGIIDNNQVEGADNKAVYQFRMSLDQNRQPSYMFWNILIGMTKHPMFSKRLITKLSRNRLLRRYPRILKFVVVNFLRRTLHKRERGREREQQIRTRKNLLLTGLKHQGNGQNFLRMTILNSSGKEQSVLFALRIYPAVNPTYPERYFGAWNWFLEIPAGELPVEIRGAAFNPSLRVEGKTIPIQDKSLGEFRDPGLYHVQVILYGPGEQAIDDQVLSCPSLILFSTKQNEDNHDCQPQPITPRLNENIKQNMNPTPYNPGRDLR